MTWSLISHHLVLWLWESCFLPFSSLQARDVGPALPLCTPALSIRLFLFSGYQQSVLGRESPCTWLLSPPLAWLYTRRLLTGSLADDLHPCKMLPPHGLPTPSSLGCLFCVPMASSPRVISQWSLSSCASYWLSWAYSDEGRWPHTQILT